MKTKFQSKSHDVLHPHDQERVISSYTNLGGNLNRSNLFISVFFFIITTWIAVFFFFDKFYPHVSGPVKLANLPYYMGLLGLWILYTTNYSFYFLKKAQNYTAGRISSVGVGLVAQSFIYLVLAGAISVKEIKFLSLSESEVLKLSIPLVDNPSNVLILSGFLFILGLVFIITSKIYKTPSSKERSDKMFFAASAVLIYLFTLSYNIFHYQRVGDFPLTSAMFTSIIMMGVAPYVYGSAIYCGAKSSKILNKNFYATAFGVVFLVLLATSYRLSSDLFILMHKHDQIDFINYSLIFVAAILIVAFSRFLAYPRLLDEYNSDVMQTRRINESNKGLMSDNDGLVDDDEDVDSLSEDDVISDNDSISEDDQEPNNKKPKNKNKKKKESSDYSSGEYAIETDNEIDGLMED